SMRSLSFLRRRTIGVLFAASVAACAGQGALREPIGESSGRPRGTTSAAPTLSSGAPSNETIEERATRLHQRAIIVDGHDDIPSVMFAGGTDIGDPNKWQHTDLTKMKTGGLTATFFSIFVEGELAEKPTVAGGGALRRAIDLIDITYRQVERHPNQLVLA